MNNGDSTWIMVIQHEQWRFNMNNGDVTYDTNDDLLGVCTTVGWPKVSLGSKLLQNDPCKQRWRQRDLGKGEKHVTSMQLATKLPRSRLTHSRPSSTAPLCSGNKSDAIVPFSPSLPCRPSAAASPPSCCHQLLLTNIWHKSKEEEEEDWQRVKWNVA